MHMSGTGVRAALAVIALLAWVSATSAQSAADALVSAQLPRSEQELVKSQIAQLPDRNRNDMAKRGADSVDIFIVDASTRTVHVNRPELRGRFVMADDPLALPGDVVDWDKAKPACNPGSDSKTGPYRRVYTTCMPALSDVQAALASQSYFTRGTVTTACPGGSFNTGAHEDGFAYLGGWSGTPEATYGNVDAGLQYNYESTEKSGDTYQPFIKVAGVKGYVPAQGDTHIKCGGSYHLEFQVLPCRADQAGTAIAENAQNEIA